MRLDQILLLFLIVVTPLAGYALSPVTLNLGYNATIYQHVFSFKSETAIDAEASMQVNDKLHVSMGTRLELQHKLYEIFTMLAVNPSKGRWRPSMGVEVGYTTRTNFTYDRLLLQEMQEATDNGISPIYVSWNASPLTFMLNKDTQISLAETQIGTHLSHFGRTIRVQISVISIGRTF